MAKLGTPWPRRCCLQVTYADDFDSIRPPTPRLSRAAVVCLALVASGAFTWGFARQVIGPLTLTPPPAQSETAASGIQAAQPLPADAAAQPAIQVAVGAPTPKPTPKAEVPDPVAAEPAATTTAPAPATAADATATSAAPAAAGEPAIQTAPAEPTPPA